MKALTLWQPWASLVVGGFKAYETRSWTTEYRGWLAIHAAAGVPKEVREFTHPWIKYHAEDFRECLKIMGYERFEDLPCGAVLGLVEIDTIYPTGTIHVSSLELAFGEWGKGRYAWHVRGIVPFDEPMPARGRQGLWDWEPSAEQLALFEYST